MRVRQGAAAPLTSQMLPFRKDGLFDSGPILCRGVLRGATLWAWTRLLARSLGSRAISAGANGTVHQYSADLRVAAMGAAWAAIAVANARSFFAAAGHALAGQDL